MNRLLKRYAARLDNVVLLGSRLLLAWLFIHESVTLTTNFEAAASGMAKMGVPPPLLVATIALQFFGGIAIAIGCQARLAAAGLGLFCLATAILFHMNFANRNELLHFDKDLDIAGGMFVLMIRGAGAWSIDRLLRAKRLIVRPSESVFDVSETMGVVQRAADDENHQMAHLGRQDQGGSYDAVA
jgi:putative oxidoreductase